MREMFPIHPGTRRGHPAAPASIPWAMLAPHEAQAVRNHGGQTLRRLAERGGMAAVEIIAVLDGKSGYDRDWSMSEAEAVAELNRRLTAHASHDGALICGQMFQSVGPLAKWPGANPDLPWHYDLAGYRGPLSAAAVYAAFEQAWGYWAAAVMIRPRRVETRAEAKVWGTFARIDGSSGVLAWSMLANNDNRPKEQRYDSGESWVSVNPGVPSGGIDLVRVACHEIGHVLGLDHDSATAAALLRPSYSTSIPQPTDRDIQRLVGLGYARRTTPVPPVTPDPPPVNGVRFALPGGGHLTADYPTKVITFPAGWVGRTA